MYERMLDLSEELAYEEMTAHCGKAGALFERLNTALEGRGASAIHTERNTAGVWSTARE